MSVEAAPDTPLLWAIREQLQMTGTKFGCGAGLCGPPARCPRSMAKPCGRARPRISDVAGKKITHRRPQCQGRPSAAEGRGSPSRFRKCGYCRVGQIMQAASLLAQEPQPDQGEVVAHMDAISAVA